MVKKLLYSTILMLVFVSCDNYKNYRLDGMWQLKTVREIDGKEVGVDTVFYSFQREAVFSYTLLDTQKFASYPFYGYVDMLSDSKIRILINNGSDSSYTEWFLSLSGWSSADIVFDIKNSNNTNLVLFDNGNGKTYTLKKF